MKLDKDLVREILLQVEASKSTTGFVDLQILDRTEEEISYHVELLSEAHYLEAHDLTTMDDYDWRPKRLTYEGHEFLETVRNPELWRATKETAKKIGVESVKVLFAVAKGILEQKLKLHGVHLA